MAVSVLEESPCYKDICSYQGSSHTVGYLTFTSGCVCGKSTSCYTDSGSYQGSSHTVGYLTFTSICVCVERVPLVTQTAVATKGVLTLLFTRAVVTFVHVWKHKDTNSDASISAWSLHTFHHQNVLPKTRKVTGHCKYLLSDSSSHNVVGPKCIHENIRFSIRVHSLHFCLIQKQRKYK